MTLKALEESDLVLFIVDGRNGIASEDYTIAELLRKSGCDVLIVANKVENERSTKRFILSFFVRVWRTISNFCRAKQEFG